MEALKTTFGRLGVTGSGERGGEGQGSSPMPAAATSPKRLVPSVEEDLSKRLPAGRRVQRLRKKAEDNA